MSHNAPKRTSGMRRKVRIKACPRLPTPMIPRLTGADKGVLTRPLVCIADARNGMDFNAARKAVALARNCRRSIIVLLQGAANAVLARLRYGLRISDRGVPLCLRLVWASAMLQREAPPLVPLPTARRLLAWRAARASPGPGRARRS